MVLCAFSVIGWLVSLCLGGASPAKMLLFLAAAFFYLLVPGWALARWVDPSGAATRGLNAVLYGCALLIFCHCLSVRLGAWWVTAVLLPFGGLALCLLRPGSGLALPGAAALRGKARALAHSVFLRLWGALLLLYTICFSAQYPHPLRAGAVDLSRDLLWNIGNAAALSRSFPAQDIRFSGVRLSYHYATELLWAALANVSGAELYDIYIFYAGPLLLAGVVLALRTTVRALFGADSRQEFRILCALLFGCSCLSLWKALPDGESRFGNTLLRHLVTNINSQATALIFFCGFLCAFAALAGQGFRGGPSSFCTLFVAYALFCLAKGPQAALTLCSLCVTVGLLLLFRRPGCVGALGCLLGTGAIFAAAWRLLFSSGTNSMQFSLFAMRDSLCYRVLSPYTDWLCAHLPVSGYVWLFCIGVCNIFCMAPVQLTLWAATLPRAVRGLPQLDPVRLLLHGITAGGFLAYQLFYHTSSSQVYFALLAIISASFLGVEPAERFFSDRRLRTFPLRFLALAACVSTGCMVFAYTRQAVRQLTITAGFTAVLAQPGGVTAGDEAAMQWLRAHAAPDACFATDRIGSTPALTDSISNCYSALSQRQAYLEGWTYAMTNMGVDRAVLAHKQEVNAALFDAQTPTETVRTLCRDEGIDYLVDAKAWPGAPPGGLVPVYENADVAIYRVGP